MKIIAHRARVSVKNTENTIESFEEALKLSYIDGSECDVQITKDGKTIISHYDKLFYISNKHFFSKISNLNKEQLMNNKLRFDIHGVMNEFFESVEAKDVKNIKFLKQYIKSSGTMTDLESLLRLYGNKKLLLIHLKVMNESTNRNIKTFQKIIVDILKEFPNNKIAIQSFNPHILKAIKKEMPKVKIGLLVNKAIGRITDDYDFISINRHFVTKSLVTKLIRREQQVMIWTVDSAKQFDQLKDILGSEIDKITVISKNSGVINQVYNNH